jgi:hypothetical protein
MILTEAAAKRKLCVDWAVADSRLGMPMCQGSLCMAWREVDLRLNARGDDLETGAGFCGKVYPVRLPP